ncbi:TPA: AAA family ATPase [Vibrio parahaemolyticus]|nr:ATP-binding protein [Vibrio parahaemolyticus]HCG9750758.1 ATP-binding protein [Vibrio parahaemolyticus]HCH6462318.1 ATP-binding protein [Vibrio parahaemolyticus]
MNSKTLLINYQHDLVKSLETPLLIELNRKEVTDIAQGQEQQVAHIPLLLAKQFYDSCAKNKTTNTIVIDGDDWKEAGHFILLEVLINQLQDEIKNIKNIGIVREVIGTGLAIGTGGLLNQFIGTYVDKGVDFLFDELGEHFSDLVFNTLTEKLDLSSKITGNVEGLLQDAIANGVANLTGEKLYRPLNLTREARSELDALSKIFGKSGKHDIFQLTFKALLATSIGSPKLIYVNNPHKLDENSLAIISLLLSYAKHRKDEDKHLGISVVYAYSDPDFQPYCTVDESLEKKKHLLDDQRRFAQRYTMLERPNSDFPVVAVKHSHFIGRDYELAELKAHFDQRDGFTITAVSGEPGVGKTALIKKHIDQIASQRSIVLTMLNEAGHSSLNTGLCSLEQSIIEEAARLEQLKNWKEKSLDYFLNLNKEKLVVDAIGKVFNNADKLINTGVAIKSRVEVDSVLEKTKQHGVGDLDNKQKNYKQQQFDKLDKAIALLYKLVEPHSPVVLFIDDIQWIDDSSSEYILTCLARKWSLYIVTSVRPSDAATLFKIHAESKDSNAFRLSLLKAIHTVGHVTVDYADDIVKPTASVLNLKGLDCAHLQALVSKVIIGTQEQATELSKAIIKELSGECSETVNTLFAIETINMLCDERLYSEADTERLILAEPIRFNDAITSIQYAIKQTFKSLHSKYQEAFKQASKVSDTFCFNLSTYAVFEERLHHLKLYFDEYGNAAVNTLIFSTILGHQFSAKNVFSLLKSFRNTDDPLLEPIKEHIYGNGESFYIQEAHYAIIEQVYDLLRRVDSTGTNYRHFHSLLNNYLISQRENLLSRTLVISPEKSLDAFYELVLGTVDEFAKHCLDHRPIANLSKRESDERISTFHIKDQVLSDAVEKNSAIWVKRYIQNRIDLFNAYMVLNQSKVDSLSIGSTYKFYSTYFESNPEEHYALECELRHCFYRMFLSQPARWRSKNHQRAVCETFKKYHVIGINSELDKRYVYHLITFADFIVTDFYSFDSDYRKAVEAGEKAIKIIATYLNPSTETCEEWLKLEASALWTLGLSHKKMESSFSDLISGNQESAMSNSLSIREEGYHRNPDYWLEDYIDGLSRMMAHYFDEANIAKNFNAQFTTQTYDLFDKSLQLSSRLMKVLEPLYNKKEDFWVEKYIHNLRYKAHIYFEMEQYERAVICEETALEIHQLLRQKAKHTLDAGEIIINSALARYYFHAEKYEESVRHGEQAILCFRSREKWYGSDGNDYLLIQNKVVTVEIHESYAKTLLSLPPAYSYIGQHQNAMVTATEAVRWIEQKSENQGYSYCKSLLTAALAFWRAGHDVEAKKYHDKALDLDYSAYSHDLYRILLSDYYYNSIKFIDSDDLDRTYKALGIEVLPLNREWTHKSIEATTETLQAVLGRKDSFFLIPSFQSSYSDNAKQIEETLYGLVNTLMKSPRDDEEIYFLGGLVIAAIYGVRPQSKQESIRLDVNVIIDGKHRIVNLMLIAMALYAICSDIKVSARSETALERWVHDRLNELKQNLQSCFVTHTDSTGSFMADFYIAKVMSSEKSETISVHNYWDYNHENIDFSSPYSRFTQFFIDTYVTKKTSHEESAQTTNVEHTIFENFNGAKDLLTGVFATSDVLLMDELVKDCRLMDCNLAEIANFPLEYDADEVTKYSPLLRMITFGHSMLNRVCCSYVVLNESKKAQNIYEVLNLDVNS